MHSACRSCLSRHACSIVSLPAEGKAGNRGNVFTGTDHSQNTLVPNNCTQPVKGRRVLSVSSARGGKYTRFHTGSGAPTWRLAKTFFCLFREPLIQGFIFLNSFFFHDSGHLRRRVVDPILIHVYTSLFSQYLRGSSLKNCTR